MRGVWVVGGEYLMETTSQPRVVAALQMREPGIV